MKLFLTTLILLIVNTSYTQITQGPEINLPQDVYDFGTVKISKDTLVANFYFKNSGTDTLYITDVKPSCGCTISSFPTNPILPGEGNVITLKYFRETEGFIAKSATIYSNSISSPVKVIRISGNLKK